jgi:type VI secretion system protein ImpH
MRDPVETLAFLEKEAYRMHFFQVLRLIENAFPELPRIGESLRPRDDPLRFGQLPELKFHTTMIETMEPANAWHPPRLIVNFFGMLGPQGPMPTHFTEYVRDRLRSPVPDPTWVRFLDIFHHRFLSLFYRVHAMGDPVISLDRQDNDRFSTYVGSMFGLGTPALQHRDEMSDFAKLHFSGLLANRVRPASGIDIARIFQTADPAGAIRWPLDDTGPGNLLTPWHP